MPYDPTRYATTPAEALQPTGINDYFGTPYVGSQMTRFQNEGQVNQFQGARDVAFQAWANRLGAQLGVPVTFDRSGLAMFNINGQQVPVTAGHYDTWSKDQRNPLEAIRNMAGVSGPIAPNPPAVQPPSPLPGQAGGGVNLGQPLAPYTGPAIPPGGSTIFPGGQGGWPGPVAPRVGGGVVPPPPTQPPPPPGGVVPPPQPPLPPGGGGSGGRGGVGPWSPGGGGPGGGGWGGAIPLGSARGWMAGNPLNRQRTWSIRNLLPR